MWLKINEIWFSIWNTRRTLSRVGLWVKHIHQHKHTENHKQFRKQISRDGTDWREVGFVHIWPEMKFNDMLGGVMQVAGATVVCWEISRIHEHYCCCCRSILHKVTHLHCAHTHIDITDIYFSFCFHFNILTLSSRLASQSVCLLCSTMLIGLWIGLPKRCACKRFG